MAYIATDLAKIVRDVRRPYLTGRPMTIYSPTMQAQGTISGRDGIWDRRRDVRHRRAVPLLPEKLLKLAGSRVLEMAYRDPLAGWMVEFLKQRQGINAAVIECKPIGDAGTREQATVEVIEDWLRGVDSELDPLGLHDQRLRDHCAGDGVGFAEVEILGRFVPTQQLGSLTPKDYEKAIDKDRRNYGLPYRLATPDARALYWSPIDVSAGLKLVVKVMDVQLLNIQDRWAADNVRLGVKGDYVDGKAEVYPYDWFYGQEQPPSPTPAEVGAMVRFVLVADDHYIYHCVVPQAVQTGGVFSDGPDMLQDLLLIKSYPNPLGRPPFFPATARVTPDADPAYMYQPLALEQMDISEEKNQLMAMRKMRAFLEAEKPWPLEQITENAKEITTLPEVAPGFMVLPFGYKIGDMPNISAPDMERLIADLKEVEQTISMSLASASQSGDVGASTPAWALNLRNEEAMGMLKAAIDSRANCKRDYLLAIAHCTRTKHGADGPVYVQTQTRNKDEPALGQMSAQVGITAKDLETPFRLTVHIRAETRGERATHMEIGRRMWQDQHVISEETYANEWALIDDPVMERRRRDREAQRNSLPQPHLVGAEAVRQTAKLLPAPLQQAILLALGPSPFAEAPTTPEGAPMQPGMEQEQALPGDVTPEAYAASPGVGMAVEQPEPRMRAAANGSSPYP